MKKINEVKKTLDDLYNDQEMEALWDKKFNELVPKEGKASTTIGEIMRCFASISHAFLQNGEIIQNMQRYYLDKVYELDDALKELGDSTLITLLDKMDLTRSKSAYEHYMAAFYEHFVNTYLKDKEVKTEAKNKIKEAYFEKVLYIEDEEDSYFFKTTSDSSLPSYSDKEGNRVATVGTSKEIYNDAVNGGLIEEESFIDLIEEAGYTLEEFMNLSGKIVMVSDFSTTYGAGFNTEIYRLNENQKVEEDYTQASNAGAIKVDIMGQPKKKNKKDKEDKALKSLPVQQVLIEGKDGEYREIEEKIEKEMYEYLEDNGIDLLDENLKFNEALKSKIEDLLVEFHTDIISEYMARYDENLMFDCDVTDDRKINVNVWSF